MIKILVDSASDIKKSDAIYDIFVPITINIDGRLEAVGKALGLAKAIKFISDKLGEYEIDKSFPILSIYSHGTENCEALEKRLAADGNPVSERLQLGSAIGTHAGPGVYGVIFVTK